MTDNGRDLRERLSQPSPSWADLRAKTDHSDKAYEFLNSAPFNGDPDVTKAMITAADVHAKLALHDKIEELSQTIKSCTNRLLDANAKLDQDVKTAAQHLHRDAAEIKQGLGLIHGEEAA